MKKQLPIPAGAGRGSLAQGFQPTIEQLAAQLGIEVASLRARLAAGDIEGEPAAYSGTRLFEPESTSFAVDYLQDGASSALCNYVVRDGAVYDIPIVVPGPGVFVATGLTVEIAQRRFDPAVGPIWANYSSCWSSFSAPADLYTTKFSLWPKFPYGSTYTPAMWMNFFWNMLDARTGDLYSDQPLNHLTLRPRHVLDGMEASTGEAGNPIMDGGLFQFDTPWVFPYGTQAVFKFQPITPVLQFDSTVDLNALALTLFYDDRENGKRNQSVKVKATLTGYRMMVSPSL